MSPIEKLRKLNERSCINSHGKPKTKFSDEVTAMLYWSTQVGTKRWKKRARNFNIYVCEHCGYMHLGHRGKALTRLLSML